MAQNLEGTVNELTISYNILPWWAYPTNWASHFPGSPLKGFEKFPTPPKFIASLSFDGRHVGGIARTVRPGDIGKAFYGAAYTLGESNDPLVEWAQDVSAEYTGNNDKLPAGRKTAMQIHIPGAGRITMQQHKPSFFDSWYGFPLKLPFYLLSAPINLLTKTFRKKELVELGKLYEVEGLPDGSDIKLDESFMKKLFTLTLGTYYDLRDHTGEVYATIERNPIIKGLSLGLKNHYKVKFKKQVNQQTARATIAMVDYVQRELEYRVLRRPKNIDTNKILQYT